MHNVSETYITFYHNLFLSAKLTYNFRVIVYSCKLFFLCISNVCFNAFGTHGV